MITTSIIVAVLVFALYKYIKFCNPAETEWFEDYSKSDFTGNYDDLFEEPKPAKPSKVTSRVPAVPRRFSNAKASLENFLVDLSHLNSQCSTKWSNNDGHYIAKDISSLLLEVKHTPVEAFCDKKVVNDFWKRTRNISSEIFYHA